MAATVLARAGVSVDIFEKKTGPGRKLLIAGSSGLNITYDSPVEKFAEFYTGPRDFFDQLFREFSSEDWIKFIENLGIATFKGTSRRYFVETMKASLLLKAWTSELDRLGVRVHFDQELVDFSTAAGGGGVVRLRSGSSGEESVHEFSAVCLCLGGGSWEKKENPLRWPEIFMRKGMQFVPFQSSNVGFQVAWPEKLLTEVEGQPIKNVVLESSRGKRSGDLVITSYGIEGTPVYFAGIEGVVYLDLKPDSSVEALLEKCERVRENLSPMRRVKKVLNLGEGALALLFHMTSPSDRGDLRQLVSLVKRFPLELLARQPLTESISSSGGLSWNEIGVDGYPLMLRRKPGVFVAGEMIDWDAPTGGFLIQACVSQGVSAGRQILKYLGMNASRDK